MQPIAILAFLLLFWSAYGSPVSTAFAKSSFLEWKVIGADSFAISGQLTSGLPFKNVSYFKRAWDQKWILDLRPSLGMVVGGQSEPAQSLTSEQFCELVEQLMDSMRENHRSVSYVHIDIVLVDAVRVSAIRAVKDAQCQIGTLENQDPCLTEALRNALRESEPIRQVRELLELNDARCAHNAVSIDPIPFQPEYIGWRWEVLKGMEDGGMILSEMFFSIYAACKSTR